MNFSVIIPARNEQHFLGSCLGSIQDAAALLGEQVQTIVVLNRCTDGTERIAREHGALVVGDDRKCLAAIRNTGAKAATGDVLLTLDADSIMSPNLLVEVARALATGKVVGGAVLIKLERYSLGLICSALMALPLVLWFGISGGCFWCRREDYEAIGGFDERRLSFEDVDFARRLKAHAQSCGKGFKVLLRASITTSCRKFDELGDWYLVRHPGFFWTAMKGTDREFADRLWYEVKRK